MKTSVKLFFALFCGAVALAQQPDCIKTFQFSGSGQTSTVIDNRQAGCFNWTVAYQSSTFSAVTLTFEDAPGAIASGTFVTFAGTTLTGANPSTNIIGNVSTFTGYYGWLRVKLTSATGTGTVTGVLYGYKSGYTAGTGSSGTCGALGGDVIGTCAASVVSKVNGIPYPSGLVANSVPLVNNSSTVAYTVVPSCPSGALSYSASTFGCNTIPAATVQSHVITFMIDGGGTAIVTGDLNIFPTAAFACTINRVDISGSPSGSITVDIWKVAGAIPTAANKISASAPATLLSAVLSQNGSRTGWSNSVSSGDVFGATVVTATSIQKATVQITCT